MELRYSVRAGFAFAIIVVMQFALSSCAKRKAAQSIPPPPQADASLGATETGVASWYGEPYHGRRAANGEIYDMHQPTAAHRTMPFGTWLRVDNLTNGKTTEVRITDRGPFVEGRIIDLSRFAAERIALIRPGIAPVRLTVIKPPLGGVIERYGVQVAALAQEEDARKLRRQLEESFSPVAIFPHSDGPSTVHRVIAGQGTREAAAALRERLGLAGHRGQVVRLPQPALAGGSQP